MNPDKGARDMTSHDLEDIIKSTPAALHDPGFIMNIILYGTIETRKLLLTHHQDGARMLKFISKSRCGYAFHRVRRLELHEMNTHLTRLMIDNGATCYDLNCCPNCDVQLHWRARCEAVSKRSSAKAALLNLLCKHKGVPRDLARLIVNRWMSHCAWQK
jgi:hypothetical protein